MILLRVLINNNNNDTVMLGRGAKLLYASGHEVLLQSIVKKKGMVKKLSQCLGDGAATCFFCFHISDKFNYPVSGKFLAIKILPLDELLRQFKKQPTIINDLCLIT